MLLKTAKKTVVQDSLIKNFQGTKGVEMQAQRYSLAYTRLSELLVDGYFI
jgi:hypothetical protein